jgi:hypothetical protein
MATLEETLLDVMRGYVGVGLNGQSYLMTSSDGHMIAVVSVASWEGKRFTDTDVVAQVHDGRIIIERDVNSKPLVDALLAVGIPRECIVLAYLGERVTDVA